MNSAPNFLTRPLSWKTWFFWIAVCAAEPTLSATTATAFGKPVLKTDPHATLIGWSLLILIAITLPAPVFLQWGVLRRIAPKLRWWIWLIGALVASGFSIVLELKARELSHAGNQFAVAALRIQSIYPFTLSDLLGLPWGRVLISTAAVAVATMLVPALIFARTAGLRWYVVLIAAVAGACTAAIVDQFYYLYGFHIRPFDVGNALNGVSWIDRIRELCLRGGTGAVWGASSGLVIAQLIRRGSTDSEPRRSRFAIHGGGGLAVMLASILVIAAAAPVCAIVFDPYKARATLDTLHKAFSFAPSSDVSEGEEVLRYSHTATVDPIQYSMAHFSPDGKSFLTVTAGRRLLRMDAATGKSLGTVGDQLGHHERHGLAWSLDGRFLALRTDGEEVPIPNTPYTRHRGRFRIYALPDYKVAGEYSHREDECFESYADPSMMFELDGKSLWVLCGQYEHPGPESLMAIRLEVPSMKVLQLRRYGDSAASEEVRGLARIGHSVWSWQHSSGKSEQFRVRDLTHDRDVVHLRDLNQPRFADNFTPQRDDQVTENRVTLRYLGGPLSGGQLIRRWLVFDTRSGRLIEKKDEPNPPVASSQAVLETSNNLRIETTWQEDSKAGKIDVIDSVSGKHRQHISTLAQRPVGLSPDGRWLVMNAFEQKTLRIYRVTP